MPLEKQSLNNFLPDGFETNNLEGYKENFSADKIATGYEKDVKDRVSGPNFNNLLDVLGKNTNVLTKFMDFIKNMPINNLFAVDENNQLVYKNLDEVGGGGLEIGDIGFTQMAIDESKGKRRVLNGQLIIQEQYVQFTNIIKNSVALNPDLACTESEWQTAVTMSAYGLCDKFVIDDEAGTIRLPKYPNYFIGGVDVPTGDIPVAGNGMSLGFTKGDVNYGMSVYDTQGNIQMFRTTAYGVKLPYSVGANGTMPSNSVMGITTDATKSGIEAHLSNDQTEQIKGTYFIQVATGAETEDNIINEIELNNPYSFGDSKYSPVALNNLSWLKSESQWNSKAVYPAYYDWLLKIYNGTETVEGVSVKLSTEDYTDYDFVLNTAEETFRLPLLDGSESLIDYTTGVEIKNVSVPYTFDKNGALHIQSGAANNNETRLYVNDALVFASFGGGQYAAADNEILPVKKGDVITSKSGDFTKIIFYTNKGNGSLYFYVGETVQNANLINAGRIEEKLANYTTHNMVDGQWVNLPESVLLASGTSSTNTIDLSEILPKDGHNYELLLWGNGQASTGSSVSTRQLKLGSDIINPILVAGYTATTIYSCFSCSIAVGTQRYLTFNATNTLVGLGLRLQAYRRLGTNV